MDEVTNARPSRRQGQRNVFAVERDLISVLVEANGAVQNAINLAKVLPSRIYEMRLLHQIRFMLSLEFKAVAETLTITRVLK